MKKIVCLLFFCYAAGSLNAQYLPLQHLSTEDGLSHANVFRIAQDKRGFIWFCTDYGLSRFDGSSFRNYVSTQAHTANYVMSVTADAYGRQWVCTYGGGLQTVTDTSLVPAAWGNSPLPARIAYCHIAADSMWMIALKPDKQLFLAVADTLLPVYPDGNPLTKTYKLIMTRQGMVLPTSSGLYILRGNIPEPLFTNAIGKQTVYDFCEDGEGGFWAGLQDSVVYIRDDSIRRSYPIPHGGIINKMLSDSKHRLWVSVNNVGVFRADQQQMTNMTTLLQMDRIIINDLFEDKEGSIWLATHGQGVYRIRSQTALYYPVQENLINVYCTAIESLNDSMVIVGSFGTMAIWHKGRLNPFLSGSLLTTEYVYDIAEHAGELYIATSRQLINVAASSAGAGLRVWSGNDRHSGVISLLIRENGQLLLGSYNDLIELSPAGFRSFANGTFYTKRVNALHEDAKGRLFVGTDSGLLIYQNKILTHFPLPGVKHGTAINRIRGDRNQHIWSATNDGLCLISADSVIRITTADGLLHNVCNDIFEDPDGYVWVATLGGVSRIHLRTREVSNIISGITTAEIKRISKHAGQLFLGTIDGLYVLSLPDEATKELPIPLYITYASAGTARHYMPESLRIRYGEKLHIRFVGLSFRNAGTLEYRYRLNNQEEWTRTGNNEVSLSALRPGKYIFSLGVRMKNGVWNESITCPVYVVAPFYQTGWFTFGLLLLSSVAVIFAMRYYILRKERKKQAQLHTYNKIIYLKQQALSALINPHFIFNCMNSIQHFLNRNDRDAANKYLSDFARLIRMTMAHAQDAFIRLDKEMEQINLYLNLEQLRFGKKLSYRIYTDPGLQPGEIFIPNMILQPYIENAIWHGIMPKDTPGTIMVSLLFHEDREHIRILIEDDGGGIQEDRSHAASAENKHKPMGMALTEERLQLLNRLLDRYYTVSINKRALEDGAPGGTIVELQIPIAVTQADMEAIERELHA